MADSINHAHEDLDAGWDNDVPAPVVPVQSLPPTPELEQLDAGWDQQSERSNPKPQVAKSGVPVSGTQRLPLDSIDEGWDAAGVAAAATKSVTGRGKKASLGKKDRRRLEREARAHQVERALENREQRKAEHRELAQQRAAELSAQREESRKQQLERKQQKAARRTLQKKARATKQPIATAPAPLAAGQTSQPTAHTPNRAERRAKSGNPKGTSTPRDTGSTATSKKKYLIGPFAIFIAVIVAASALSYYAFMN